MEYLEYHAEEVTKTQGKWQNLLVEAAEGFAVIDNEPISKSMLINEGMEIYSEQTDACEEVRKDPVERALETLVTRGVFIKSEHGYMLS